MPLDYLLEQLADETEVETYLFADDGELASSDIVSLQRALNGWADALEGNGYRISGTKTEYLFCPFSDPEQPVPDIYLHRNVLPKYEKFKYLGSMINKEANCDDDVKHRVSVGWMKWLENSAIICNPRIPQTERTTS